MDFKKRILEIEKETSKYENVKIIAATKYMNVDQTKALVEAGIKCLGENRTDLFLEKYEALKDYDIEWHFFGVLQSRKIKDVVNKIESNLLKLQKQEISTKDIVTVALEVLMEVSAMACLVYFTQHTECETFDDVRRFINR